MKKIILKGPKLIAVGPLKCFKGGGGGSSGGGGGGGGGSKPKKSSGKGGGGGSGGGSKKPMTMSGFKAAEKKAAQKDKQKAEQKSFEKNTWQGRRQAAERSIEKKKQDMQKTQDAFGNVIGAVGGIPGKAVKYGMKKFGQVSDKDAMGQMSKEAGVEAAPGHSSPYGAPSRGGKNRSGGPQHGGIAHRGPKIVGGTVIPAGSPVKPSGEVPKPAEPKTPGSMTEAELEAMLAKRARGEDSVVEKEAQLARERGLSQQLSAIRGARGATAGQRLRALSRGQEALGRDLGAQTAIAKAKEQEANQKALLALKRGDRQLAEKYAHEAGSATYKGTGSGGGGGGRSPGQSFGDKLKTGLNIVKTGKKIWDIGSSFFEEGGKVEGPGSETSDSIPARLSDGEFVVKASAVRGLGKELGAKDKDEERQKGVDFLYKLQDKMDKSEKFNVKKLLEKKKEEKLSMAKGGEAYVRPKKAFREAIGYEPESRFHDKAEKDAKHGGARRKFRHFGHGGEVSFGSVVSAKKRLNKNLEKLKRK